ncbi:hypothetical protein ACH0AE_01480 [Sphingomonas sp. 179-A 2A2 NHS]
MERDRHRTLRSAIMGVFPWHGWGAPDCNSQAASVAVAMVMT